MTSSAGSLDGFKTGDIPDWWYMRGEDTLGPVTASGLRHLAANAQISPDDLVWRHGFGDEWKRLDDVGVLPPVSRPQTTRTSAALNLPTYNPKWQKIFDAAAAEESAWSLINPTGARRTWRERKGFSWRLQSIPGFLFGPLYYFYLGMWRKGILLIALLPIIVCIEGIFGDLKFLNILIPVLCATAVKRDYYKLCTRGERVWPFLRWSKNIWTDVALVFAVSIAAILIIMAFDDGTGSDQRSANAITQTTAETASNTDPDGILTVSKVPDFTSHFPSFKIRITSKINNLRIGDFKVNRGVCLGGTSSSGRLRFGETFEIYLANCNPLEAEIQTDHGKFQFSWKE